MKCRKGGFSDFCGSCQPLLTVSHYHFFNIFLCVLPWRIYSFSGINIAREIHFNVSFEENFNGLELEMCVSLRGFRSGRRVIPHDGIVLFENFPFHIFRIIGGAVFKMIIQRCFLLNSLLETMKFTKFKVQQKTLVS